MKYNLFKNIPIYKQGCSIYSIQLSDAIYWCTTNYQFTKYFDLFLHYNKWKKSSLKLSVSQI